MQKFANPPNLTATQFTHYTVVANVSCFVTKIREQLTYLAILQFTESKKWLH